MIWTAITFARQAWLIRHVEKALLVERRLDLGCEPVDVLNAFESLMTSAAAVPAVVRRSVDRAVANRRIESAVMRILHEMRKPHLHQHTR
jgi:hypothetical protein